MSWDIFVQDLPPGIASIADIPDGFVPSPIGLRSEVIAKLSALYPECSFADPSWGVPMIAGVAATNRALSRTVHSIKCTGTAIP
jgi:hypothetical protein